MVIKTICKFFLLLITLLGVAYADDFVLEERNDNSSHLEKLNPDDVELSKIFSADIRRDENFLKAIDSSINFYASILGTDQLFSYANEEYTPLQMLHSLIMFRKMATVDRPFDEFLIELQERFDLYTPKNQTSGSKFTGYYTPEIPASVVKTRDFNHPLYLSKTKIKSNKADFYVQATNDIKVLVMEGAGILTLKDGQTFNIQYAGKKKVLIAPSKKKVKLAKKSSKKTLAKAKLKPKVSSKAVFYITQSKALGSISTELVPGYSAAMDMSLTPAGSLIYVKGEDKNDTNANQVVVLNEEPKKEKKSAFESFMLVHDIGQAIKGLGRIDIYCGEGKTAKSCTYDVSTTKGLVYLLIAKKNALLDFLPQGIR